jgi:hypothetical protein
MEYGWRTVKDSLHPVYFEGKTRSLQNNETARQKSVHDYVVNTLNSSARVYEWTFLHDSEPWQEHMSVHARFCSAQT